MPRKTFTSGEVLTAANVNLYLSNEVNLTTSATAAYTVASTDRYKTLVFTNTAAGTVTFGTATAFQAGERVDIIRDGSGTLRIISSAVTISGGGTAGTAYTLDDRYTAVSVVCVGSNSYRIIGSITAV